MSAGYDAHRDDPLAGLQWTAGDYADLTKRVIEAAPQRSRIIVMLEGGYALSALTRSVAATAATLAGVEHRPEAASNGGPGAEAVQRAVDHHVRGEP